MLKRTFIIILAMTGCFMQSSKAQWDGTSIDPAAKNILDNLKEVYDGYKTMEVDFTLTLELPESTPEVQNGKIGQDGERYFVVLEDQEIYCDGSNIWLYQKDINEAQLSNAESEEDNEGFLSPKDMLRAYDSEDFIYAITDTKVENDVTYSVIEFKPTDSNSEYTKMRLIVNDKKNEMKSLKVFSRDGSRFTLVLKRLTPNKTFTDDQFIFDKSKYAGVYIEDLRID